MLLIKRKRHGIKIEPYVSANRSSNNWALDGQRKWGGKFLA